MQNLNEETSASLEEIVPIDEEKRPRQKMSAQDFAEFWFGSFT